jgi:rhodanese-related sulfurtransferase
MEAYSMVEGSENTYILDCRTEAEWMYVGHPGKNKAGEGSNLSDKVVNISSMVWRKGIFIKNPSFINDVSEVFEDKEAVVLIIMCRSGQRSVEALKDLENAGYKNLYNMKYGFEGSTDINGYRTLNGWKVEGLPYTFSGAGYQD